MTHNREHKLEVRIIHMLSWLKNNIKKSRGLIGLHVGADNIKLLHILPCKTTYKLTYHTSVALPPSAVVDHEIKDTIAISKVLLNALNKMPIACQNVAIALPDSQVISKVIQLEIAKLTASELEARIWFEANKHIPHSIEDIYLDYQILNASIEDDSRVNVLIVAVRKNTLAPYLTAITAAGLTPKIVDVESYAVVRASHYANSFALQQSVYAVLVIDITTLTFTVLQTGNRIFTRSEILSANTFEAALSIWQRMLQFYFASHPHEEIEQLFLAGDASLLLLSLASYIQQELTIKVTVANPFDKIVLAQNIDEAHLSHCAASYLVSCGLALRC